jgi:hypothetical protein
MPFVEVGAKSKKTIEFQGSNESLRLLNDVQSVGGSNRPCRDGRSNIELKKLRKSQNTQGRKDSFDRTHPIEKRTTPITKEENDLYALLKSPENARNQLLRSVLEVNSSLLMDYSVPVRTAPICNFGDSDLVRFLIDNGHMKKIGRSSREVIFSCLTWDFEIWKGRRDRLYDYQTSLQLMEKWLKSEPNLEDFEDKFFTIADTYLRRMNSRNDVFDLDEANFYGELLKIGVRQFPILLAKDPNIAEVLLQREAWDVIREAIDNEPKAAFVKIPNRNASIVERAFQANEANREKFVLDFLRVKYVPVDGKMPIPLAVAVLAKDYEKIIELAKKNPKIVDQAHLINVAVRLNDLRLINLCKRLGASVKKKDSTGMSALDLATSDEVKKVLRGK